MVGNDIACRIVDIMDSDFGGPVVWMEGFPFGEPATSGDATYCWGCGPIMDSGRGRPSAFIRISTEPSSTIDRVNGKTSGDSVRSGGGSVGPDSDRPPPCPELVLSAIVGGCARDLGSHRE